MTALRDALEALGHPLGALPEPRLLADLFVRFQTQVPLRPAPAGLGPHELASAWLEDGRGLLLRDPRPHLRGPRHRGGLRARAWGRAGRRRKGPPRSPRRRTGASCSTPSFPLPAPLPLDPPAFAESDRLRHALDAARRRGAGPTSSSRRAGTSGSSSASSPGEPGAGERSRQTATPANRSSASTRTGCSAGATASSRSPTHGAASAFRFPASDSDGLEALFGPPIPAIDRRRSRRGNGCRTDARRLPRRRPWSSPRLLRLLSDPGRPRCPPSGGMGRGGTLGVRGRLREGCSSRRESSSAANGSPGLGTGSRSRQSGPLALFRTRTWRLEPRAGGNASPAPRHSS